MKRITYTLIALIAIAFTSCEKETTTNTSNIIEGEWTATSMNYNRSGEEYELIISNSDYYTEYVNNIYTNPELYKRTYLFDNIDHNRGDYIIKHNKTNLLSTSTSYPFRSTYEVLNEMEVVEKGKFKFIPNDNGNDTLTITPYNSSYETPFTIIELTSNSLITERAGNGDGGTNFNNGEYRLKVTLNK